MKKLINNLLSDKTFQQQSAVGLLCNQVSFDFVSNKYLFEILNEKRILKRLFIPEHGLFGELQDQEKLNRTDVYADLGLEDVEVKSLYQKDENSLAPKQADLADLEAIVIDIQDVGCRYFTFTSTIFYLIEVLKKYKLSTKIFVLNRANPAGESIEGTPISKEYASFIGLEGLPHRHGMTIAELCMYFKQRLQAKFDLYIISEDSISRVNPLIINPSPNIPNEITPLIYSGQCLFEGTNWSEGRGTTRPFEIVGSPNISWKLLKKISEKHNSKWKQNAVLRPLSFIPTFHKFSGKTCNGFQLHLIEPQNYHSLQHSLEVIRDLAEICNDFWRKGKYEFGSAKTAIELLAGDKDLLDFLKGKQSLKFITEKLQSSENEWFKVRKEIRNLINEKA